MTVKFMFLFLFTLIGCTKPDISKELVPISTQNISNLESARIKTAHGDVIFKFRPDKAPETVKRIKELIQSGFYNGLIFHRVVPGFVVQGGDPTGSGRGGSGKNIQAEFNDLKHVPGTVAMARSQDVNSADSQFYICLGTFPHLDSKYTIFGQVTDGLEVVKKIAPQDKIISMSLE